MRGFFRRWLQVSLSTWLLRAFLVSVGIEAMEGIHGWPRIIPVVLGGMALVATLAEVRRKRRSTVA